MLTFNRLLLPALLVTSLSLVSCKDDTTTATTDGNAVDYSFVVIGCNRLDKADTSTANPSTANLEQLSRTFSEVAQMSPKPDYLFFAGDMVLGYTPDTVQLAIQLKAWKAAYEASPLAGSGVKLVAVPGNHEVQNDKKIAYAAAERQWLSIMAPYINGSNGPAAGGADSLATDQSRLTYSFNFKDAHFVVLNTDPVGKDWRVPTKWIATDVAAAHGAGVKHIFAIGHKPAYPWDGADGLAKYPTDRDNFWSALEGNNSEAMLAAHNHLFYKEQPHGKTWQIVAGNGGSILETGLAPDKLYYGYTVVSVLKNGRVIAKSMGRDIPAASYKAPAPASTYPTTMRDSLDITWH
ncbi:MAG: metallophosphoesterase [Bacteroidota bacterium]